ncbi:MAG: DUF2150 family protein [Halodesulfurarchaeum sp.]|nr:DUF2150 family protein [Halodesulfurarchaeum sp.]
MSDPEAEFYTEERWENWLDRLREEEIDPEDEDSARLLLNLQDDVAIAVAKILTALEDGSIDAERAMDEIVEIRDVVLADPEIENEDTLMLVDGVQTSLVCVFYSAERYVAEGPVGKGTVEKHIRHAAEAEAEDDLDTALGHASAAGTLLIDGAGLDISVTEAIEYGLVTEWVNGLDSLQEALADPEVIEEED